MNFLFLHESSSIDSGRTLGSEAVSMMASLLGLEQRHPSLLPTLLCRLECRVYRFQPMLRPRYLLGIDLRERRDHVVPVLLI